MKPGLNFDKRVWIEQQLLPCPFCGNEPILMRSSGEDCRKADPDRNWYYIKCKSCGIMLGYEPYYGGFIEPEYMLDLIRLWNTRKEKIHEQV
jgi:Lar family restriction alleviation protein